MRYPLVVTRCIAAIMICGLSVFPLAALAQTAVGSTPISFSDLVKPADYTQLSLSPDRKLIGAIAPVGPKRNLVIIDLEKRTRQVVTEFKEYDVVRFRWVNNQRVLLTVGDFTESLSRIRFRGTWAINIDGTNPVDFSQEELQFIKRVGENSNEIIATMQERSKEFADVYRVDTRSKRKQLLSFESPGRTNGWVLDKSNVPRVAFREEEDWASSSVWYRSGEGAKWKKISSCARSYLQECEVIVPIAFAGDQKTLYVSSNIGRDKMAIFKYDPETETMGEKLVESPLIDLAPGDANLILDSESREPVGLRYRADQDRTVWFDPKLSKIQARLDSTLPGKINSFFGTVISQDDDGVDEIKLGGRLVVFSYAGNDPGTYYLYDLVGDKIEPIVKPFPWIKPEQMPKRQFVVYKARDGLEILAWLTLPLNSTGKNLPTVVNIHGGPYVRAYGGTVGWGFYPDSVALASRGFAVLEPEPRGGVGFGRKHFVSAVKQWGLTMQDDLTDATKWLISEGIADPAKICLHGGSYGGYATLMGLAKEPDLYACGSASVAVTDMETFITIGYSDTNSQWNGSSTYYKRYVADLSTELEKARQTSPLMQVARIKTPVQLIMGSDDRRVPLVNGEKFRDAMAALGKPVTWHVYAGEGHGFQKPENRADYYTRVVDFLMQHTSAKQGRVTVKHPVPASN